ncbi:MAG: hypothetical protein IT221_05760 [Fluviicola sp.]|nr:hypothetical protein [Fluviicola sp.]
MKKGLLVVLLSVFGTALYAQEKRIEKNVSKEVNMEEINGELVLTVILTDGDTKTYEVYKGAEAEAKYKELEATMRPKTKNEEVFVTEENGIKTVRIQSTENGVVKEEVFTGEKANAKLKELGLNENTKKAEIKQETIIEQRELKKGE